MDPPKFESYGTHIYNPPSQLSPTCIHIVGVNPDHILDGEHDTAYEVRDW